MCLFLKASRTQSNTAVMDMIVYKVMLQQSRKVLKKEKWYKRLFCTKKYVKCYISPFKYYPYIAGALNVKVALKIEDIQPEEGLPMYSIREGYHSCSFDSNILKSYQVMVSDSVIVKCIIPKGTKYYTDGNGNYVSENIIIIGEE